MKRLDQDGLQCRLQKRRKHEQAPDAIDDAGNAGQQFDGNANRPPQPLRAQFGEKEGDHQANRYGDQHGDERGNQRAVYRGQRTILVRHRVPALADKKAEAECPECGQRTADQRDDDAAQQQQYANRGGTGQIAEYVIAQAEAIEHFGARHRRRCESYPVRKRNIDHWLSPRRFHNLSRKAVVRRATQAAFGSLDKPPSPHGGKRKRRRCGAFSVTSDLRRSAFRRNS